MMIYQEYSDELPTITVVIPNVDKILSRLTSSSTPIGFLIPGLEIGQKWGARTVIGALHDAKLPNWPPVAHDVRRLSVEMLIVAEIYKRLGIILSDELNQSPEGVGDRVSDIAVKSVVERLDLSNPIVVEPKREPFFSVLFEAQQISLESPISVRSAIKVVYVAISVASQTASAPPVPPVSKAPIVGAVAAAVSAASSVATLGYTIFRGPEAKQQMTTNEIELMQRLVNDYAKKNVYVLQFYLAQVGFFHDRIDGKWGKETSGAVARFAVSRNLPENVSRDHSSFILALVRAVAEKQR